MFRFLTGTVKYKIKSSRCESLINRLRVEIPLYGIKKSGNDTLEFATGYRYRKAVEAAVYKMNAEIIQSRSYGLPALADKYKRRTGIWLGLLLSVTAVFISSGIIWEVRISGNTYVTDADIALNLKRLNVSEGRIINKQALERVYNSFLINEPRISWISVNFDGTVAKVMVKEAEIVPERLERDKNINVVAKCDGLIKRVDVFDGTKEVSSGDVVTKGQLLISSFTETRKTGVFMKAARGNVWAATVHKFEIHIKRKSNVKMALKDVKKKNSILVLGTRIPVYMNDVGYDDYAEAEHLCKRYALFGKFPLPFVTETKVVSLFDISAFYSDADTAKKRADAELEKRISSELSDAEIVEINVSSSENDDEFVFLYELLCIENIGMSVEFDFN